MDRPDWGHGSNQPIPVFTEDEIRVVMKKHHPSIIMREGLCCSCSINPRVITNFNHPPFTVDHFIAKLKEAHYGRQETQHPHPA